jgi:glycine/D-amino acid oxidase-like deaminating enzyme
MSENRHSAWQWLKAEVDQRFGADEAEALWEEYSRRLRADYRYNEAVRRRKMLKRNRKTLAELQASGASAMLTERNIKKDLAWLERYGFSEEE